MSIYKINPYLVRIYYGPLSYSFFLPDMDNYFLIAAVFYNIILFLCFYGKLNKEQKTASLGLFFIMLFFNIYHYFIFWQLFLESLNRILDWVNLFFYIAWNFVYFPLFFRSMKNLPDDLLDISLAPAFTKKYNLTEREIEITGMLIQGKSNSFISEKLFISIRTVKNHQKTSVKNRIELACLIKNT